MITLIHLVKTMAPGSIFSAVYGCVKHVHGYRHVVITTAPLLQIDMNCVYALQAVGVPVKHVEAFDRELSKAYESAVAIAYCNSGELPGVERELNGYGGVALAMPTVFYLFGGYDDDMNMGTVIACSEYACGGDRIRVLPPFLDARALHGLAGVPGSIALGLLCPGGKKYPCELAVKLLNAVDPSIRLYISVAPDNAADVKEAMIQARFTRNCTVVEVPRYPDISESVIPNADVVLYGAAPGYNTSYGRTVMEAMACGKAVVCESRGGLMDKVKNKVNAITFSDIGEGVAKALWLCGSQSARANLGRNAALTAGFDNAHSHVKLFEKTIMQAIRG